MKTTNITLLDGGMGQELRRRSNRPVTPLWSAQVMLDEPELVVAVHRDFIQAGAQVITANTYVATPQRLARDGQAEWLEPLHEAALDAAHQARNETEQSGRIAGCLPPLVASYHADVVPDDATCLRDYRRLVAAQAARVDLFICETMSLTREALAATRAGKESGLPVWTAFSVDDRNGAQLRSGEPLAQATDAAVKAGADAVLINCSTPEAVSTALITLAKLNVPFGAYANGFKAAANLSPGGTVDALSAREELTPAAYADYAERWIERGATIIGGCCEIGPRHIEAIKERLLV
ncbi:MAG: homocysteine S-methyltransferase family protein [Gammaproteobacteria bacterium]|nr:homocysteine S-methyltransferase family protein [Gammaproteobacteria bacterium]